jgi:hemerythrin-like domain-containing protein
MDAITLLKQDHKTVEGLFKKFEKAGENAHKTQEDLAAKIIEELSVHAAIEEQVFYPAIREAVPETEDEVLESLEEHHVAKWLLSELSKMSPEEERFRAKTTVLIESVRHHVEEEESELFPAVRKALGRKVLQEIGAALEEAKKGAPRNPKPTMSDTPPGNVREPKTADALGRAKQAVAKAGS